MTRLNNTQFLKAYLLAFQSGGDLIQHGEWLRIATPILLRTDFDASRVQAAAKITKNGPQVRRLLAPAAIYDGCTRGEAARIGGVTLQIVRDWAVKFNAYGPDGLVDHKAIGSRRRRTSAQRRSTSLGIFVAYRAS